LVEVGVVSKGGVTVMETAEGDEIETGRLRDDVRRG
jgi:hypothetical protein